MQGHVNYEDSIVITSNAKWEIKALPAAEWLSIDKMSGSGNAVVHFKTLQLNNNEVLSETILTITAAEVPLPIPTAKVKVSQSPILSVLNSKLYGGKDEDDFSGELITPDGGRFLWGATNSSANGDVMEMNNGAHDYWITKLNSTGAVEWSRSLGGSDEDFPSGAIITSDGHYMVCGVTYSNDRDVTGNAGESDAWVIKLNSSGDEIWRKTYGGAGYDAAHALVATADGGAIIGGYDGSNAALRREDLWMFRIKSDGVIAWDKKYGGSKGDWAGIIKRLSENRILVTGYTESNNGDVSGYRGENDIWWLELDENGNILSNKVIGGSGRDYLSSVSITAGGNYLLTGSTDSKDGDLIARFQKLDAWVMMMKPSGEPLWTKTFGGSGDDGASGAISIAQGDIIVVGATESADGDIGLNKGATDGFILKLNKSADILWKKIFGGENNDSIFSILQTSDGQFEVVGSTGSSDGDFAGNPRSNEGWILKFN